MSFLYFVSQPVSSPRVTCCGTATFLLEGGVKLVRLHDGSYPCQIQLLGIGSGRRKRYTVFSSEVSLILCMKFCLRMRENCWLKKHYSI